MFVYDPPTHGPLKPKASSVRRVRFKWVNDASTMTTPVSLLPREATGLGRGGLMHVRV